MAEIFCIKCKEKKLIQEALEYDRMGRPIYKGKCPDCGSNVQKFISRAEVNSLVKNKYTEMSEGEYDEHQAGESNDNN